MPTARMTGEQRRAQVLRIAAEEFAAGGLHGTSTETIARRAGIAQPYVFRLFGTKKRLFVEVVDAAFERLRLALLAAAGGSTGLEALSAMGQEYNALLADRTSLLLQLQGFAAGGDEEVRAAVRTSFGRLWTSVAGATGLDAVTVKTFLAFGMLLNTRAALDVDDLDEDWARQAATLISPGLFAHITAGTNR
jgi:AcrR family transcriptional regulator